MAKAHKPRQPRFPFREFLAPPLWQLRSNSPGNRYPSLATYLSRLTTAFLIYGTGIRNRSKSLITKDRIISNLRYSPYFRLNSLPGITFFWNKLTCTTEQN